MSNWVLWLIAAGVLVIIELATGTFYLLMVAFGLVAGAMVAWLDYDLPAQLLAAGVVGVMATLALHYSRYGASKRSDPARDANVNIDIGRSVTVNEWRTDQASRPTARVMYRGAMWDVELAAGEDAHSGVFTICALHGNRLVVTAS